MNARSDSHWFRDYRNSYTAFQEALNFFELNHKIQLNLEGFDDSLSKYTKTFYQLDLHHRRFVTNAEESGITELFHDLMEKVEKCYINQFVIPLNNKWQEHVEKNGWQSAVMVSQSSFFEKYIQPYVDSKSKIFVIISDALRYECASELKEMIERQDRYQAKIEPMLGCLPSYTQLGMAALLPNKKLEIDGDGTKVLVDEVSSQGLQGRNKILNKIIGDKAKAMHLEDFIKLNNEDGRTLVKEFDLFYLYHNEIDKIGDDSASEHKVFGAVKRTQETLIQALKRITAFNGNNILITSDHGFLYQQKELNESDFVEVKVEGDEVWKQARRFIIGKALKTNKSMWCVNSDELGMEGNLNFQFPRSISRLKKTGAGKQFVHGGTSLQEVVVPCIVIKKKRVSDIKQVNISILNPQKIITTNQVTISFYQDEPVSTKVLKRKIKAAFYDIKGDLISEIHEITFDIEASESELRVKKQTFVFNPSLENDLECELKISSKVEGSNQFVPYEQYPHHLKKTFDLDF